MREAYTEIKAQAKRITETKDTWGRMKGDKGVAQGKGAGAHKFTGIIEIQWKRKLS